MYKKLAYLISLILILSFAEESARGLEVKINFQHPSSVTPEGYLPDSGEIFGDRGNGFSYGWDESITGDARERSANTDQRYDTLVQMQEGDPRTWEIELPNGGYEVFVACGDASYNDQINTIDVEGNILTDPDGRDNYDEYFLTVFVSDGRLTIKPAPGGLKCKIMFLHINTLAIYKAYNPDPADDSLLSQTSVNLSWTAGDLAVSHNVYFSDNFEAVSTGDDHVFLLNQTDTSLVVGSPGNYYPDGLVPGATYYWRVDEVNEAHPDSPWEGDVWSFTIPATMAYNPDPADNAEFIYPNVTLGWTPGFGAQSHTVYIDSDLDDLNNAAGGDPQTETTFTPPPLAKNTVYYWRVDEYDGVNTYKGEVWSFKTIPDVPIADPNLLCWWKFDEVFGDIILDYSGYDHFGTVHGASAKLDGRVGGALYFGGDGDYVVDEDAENYLNGLSAITVCMWLKSGGINSDLGFMDCVEPDNKDRVLTMRYDRAGVSYGGRNVIKIGVVSTPQTGPDYEQQLESSSNVQSIQWQHIAMTWSGGDVIRLYINGIEDTPTGMTEPNDAGGVITDCEKLIIGKGGKDIGTTAGWRGYIDDVRIYNIVLTAEDITQVMRGESDLAWNPSPTNGSTPDLHHTLPLSWLAGDNAVEHDVYFGTDQEAVANANISNTSGIYRGRQTAASYIPDEGVEWGTGPYYWRVDEYNTDGTITKGRLWQFTVADFILVDDFESYNDFDPDQEDSNRIYLTWLDGYDNPSINGSIVGYPEPDFAAFEHFVETTIIHGGRQSMPYFYNNSVGNSEATMMLTYPRDWTEQDVKVLTLWFRGYPASFKEEPAGTYTMSASGEDIGGTSDEFRYTYKRLSGAGSITAQVLSVENTNEWAKAGVMIRRTLEPGSPFAAVYITPENGCRYQGRLTIGGELSSDTSVATPEQRTITAPYWVKIERDNDNNFNGYYSSDGVNWTAMAWNPQSIVMHQDVYIGLALTSHNPIAVCKATFSDVETTGTVTPATWTQEAIGTEMLSNDSEPMYVVLNDNAVVYNNDPDAVQIDEWKQWNIDLQNFADKGVNLTNVDSIGIGFGDRDNPQVGGSGLVFFDDIRLYRAE
jgi:hypothetical protein